MSAGERLQQARGALSFVCALLWMGGPFGLWLHLVVAPLWLLLPAWRPAIISHAMRLVCHGIFFFFRLGGARFRTQGVVESDRPGLVVMNHQSLLDIPTLTLLGRPYVPVFIPRARYARWYVPLVALCIWMLRAPAVDPKRDARGSVLALRRAAREMPHALAIYPEGHRTRGGELGPFRTAGISAILEERPGQPVWLVVTDGFWKARTLLDFVLNVHHLRGETEVMGPFESPTDPEAIPVFIEHLQQRMKARLAEMRSHAGQSPEAPEPASA